MANFFGLARPLELIAVTAAKYAVLKTEKERKLNYGTDNTVYLIEVYASLIFRILKHFLFSDAFDITNLSYLTVFEITKKCIIVY